MFLLNLGINCVYTFLNPSLKARLEGQLVHDFSYNVLVIYIFFPWLKKMWASGYIIPMFSLCVSAYGYLFTDKLGECDLI